MSDVINPEHECPFDPKHYQCDCFIAPVGSFSWALIQLKLRKRVTRSVWVNCQGNNEMYLAITPRVNNLAVEEGSAYAVDGVAVGTQYDYLTHIDLRNEHGNFVPWQPTQEDMMACDWGLKVRPDVPASPKHTLIFDITPLEMVSERYWGVTTNYEGKLVMVGDHAEANKYFEIFWSANHNELSMDLEALTFLDGVEDKKLIITIDGIKYDLGYRFKDTTSDSDLSYIGIEAEKIGDLLKQTGKTYRFHCEWYD
ncbi:hypothetical protein Xvie_03979 [Xenorhabdus vietnamensis]|uniref:DUF2829 domain-containing protein n=1 Tax=Xenorhabdus vietnamensis TaxID=351656 RepID=A0A1Y2S698_9GAMM|nr:DUF2829 domain-containing protein [Xenorhabdus vietnamensis]OTA14125.1 hypothetical protein Xvie_03979 [Xenorhabdus vietnamensis]